MKWFKHYSNARGSNALTKLQAEMGLEGYGRYWVLLERMSEKFDGEDTHFAFITPGLMKDLGIYHFNVLLKFAECLNNVGLMSVKCDKKLTEISSPILLELQSRDFKKARSERADGTPKNKDIREKNKEEELDKEPPANLKDLNALFQGRVGEATYKLISTKTKQVWIELYEGDLNFIVRAFLNAFAKWAERAPKDQGNPDTFFTTQLKYDWPHHVERKAKFAKSGDTSNLMIDWAKGEGA